jgi:hypothetical protein
MRHARKAAFPSRSILCLSAMLCLPACGGGSKSDSAASPPPPAQPPAPLTFTVGGTVTGLQGTGLVLRNTGVDLPVATSGSFRFTTALADGATYDVTIVTQPSQPAQRCTITGGQGQIRGADVGNVSIECRTLFEFLSSVPVNGAAGVSRSVRPTLTFSAPLPAAPVSSSIAGLTSIDGSEPIAVSASGSALSVTPSRLLLPLADYTLVVGDSLQSADGGTLAAPVQVTFRTTDGAWGIQEALTGTSVAAGGLNVLQPLITADAAERATVVWANERGTLMKREVWARHRPAGGPWEPAVRLDGSDSEDVGDVVLASADDGTVLVAWAQSESGLAGDFNRILYRRFTPAGGWQAIQLVAQMTGDLTQLQIAMHADGSAALVWYQAEPGRVAINASRYVPATGWTSPQRIDAASGVVFRPQIAVSDGGIAMAVWEQYLQGAGNDIFAARYEPVAGWSIPARVSVNNTGIAINPSLASAPSGDAVVTWQQTIGAARYTASSYFSAGQSWSAPERLESGAGQSDSAQVAMDPQRIAIAVWRQAISGTLHVHASRRDPATGVWSTPQRISNVSGGTSAFYPAVRFDRRGNALAIWHEVATTIFQVHGNRYTVQNGWGVAGSVGTPDRVIGAFTPRLVVDGSGSAWAAWSQQDSLRTPRILVNRFE